MQIFVAVTGSVIAALIIYLLGLEGSSTPPVILPEYDNTRQLPDEEKFTDSQAVTPVSSTIKITNSLSVDQYGQGQIEETVIIDINGQVESIDLSTENGNTNGSVKFELPADGFFNYEINTSSAWNNLSEPGIVSHLTGNGRGEIQIRDGDIFQVALDAYTLENPKYKVYLKKIE